MRKKVFTVVTVMLLAATMAMASGRSEGSGSVGTVKVGAKNFTEQYNIGQIMSQLLEANGFTVKQDFGMSSTVARKALTSGQIDLYADYTGTVWVTYLKHNKIINDPEQLYNAIKQEDAQKNNIEWIEMLPVNNTYALAVTHDFAQKHNLQTLSDLASLVNNTPNKYKFAIDYEFFQRPGGFKAMAKAYGMNIPDREVKTMDIGLAYQSIEKGDVDIAMVFSTDGRLKKYNLTVLNDDRHFFPYYNLAIAVRKPVLDKYPQIRKILAPLESAITRNALVNMNYEVDAQKKEPVDVAHSFLVSHDLIKN